tara:strand:+ start:338 stop:637 length:300 start_codon:yes stop_codon:yes gene_type:complete
MEKPKDYQPGGQEALNNAVKENSSQLIFITSMLVWCVSSVWDSITNFMSGEYNIVTVSSLGLCVLVGGYLKVRQVFHHRKLFPGVKKSECKKCGSKGKK